MVSRTAAVKGSVVAAVAVIIIIGAGGLYIYTLAPTSPNVNTSLTSSANSNTTTATGGSSTATAGGGGPTAGWQDKDGQPQGAWANYLGYVPNGYVLAAHYPNANVYPCPSGMNPQQCAQFKASCGNGVCDPNESCSTCPIDCGVAGQLTCDPYTGRPGAPISICQMPVANG